MMLFQKLVPVCRGCLSKHLLQYSQCQKYKVIQERQLMHYTKNILHTVNIQGRQAKQILQLVRYFSANHPSFDRFHSCNNSRTSHLCQRTSNSFQNSVRYLETKEKSEEEKKYDAFVEKYKQDHKDDIFQNGISVRQALIITLIAYFFYYLFTARPVQNDSNYARNWMVTLYRKMPLKSMSRIWGKMTCMDLPMTLREPLLGLYVWMFGVQLHEAEDDNLKNYSNLNEFFRRKLKPDIRIVDPVAPVTSPADGKILHFGKVEDGIVEQVKGVNYTIQGFLGPQPGDEERTKPLKDSDYQENMKIKPGYDLFNCIIYLAPGDYHRFHSSTDWKITHRRHFPGELLSVNPGVARWVQGLFNMNERAVYSGTWEHGYFSYTAVGATNVGSIKIYFDENLETNTGASHPNHVYHDRSFGSPGSKENVSVKKGEMLGEFNLGSTIVLLFEAPEDFKFNVSPGQKVKVGESLGQI